MFTKNTFVQSTASLKYKQYAHFFWFKQKLCFICMQWLLRDFLLYCNKPWYYHISQFFSWKVKPYNYLLLVLIFHLISWCFFQRQAEQAQKQQLAQASALVTTTIASTPAAQMTIVQAPVSQQALIVRNKVYNIIIIIYPMSNIQFSSMDLLEILASLH